MLEGVLPEPVGAAELGLSDAPKLGLDELLSQLISRAEEVLAAQGRLRGLLTANRAVIGDLALPVVLRRIVEAACGLVNAQYGALGVLAPTGGLAEFIYVGIDEEAAARIGHLPEGKGLLGALIDDPRPIRLRAIADDSRSVGFPANHPPMNSFLGVPIRVRNEVFGNLYLSERHGGGEFTEEDEELVLALAATAGVAIENARLYGESTRRQEWLEASAQVTQQLLSASGENPLQLIALRTAAIADADAVSVVLPTPDGERLQVEVAAGEGAAALAGMTYPRADTLAGVALETGQPILVPDVRADRRYRVHMSDVLPVGPVMVLPLVGTSGVRGALVVGRLDHRRRFEEADLDMAVGFANHAALALELADARDAQQRMVLLEDRDRIARDLHDHVIQRLFATGLSIQSVAASVRIDDAAGRLSAAVSDIDETIRQIRSSIFQLRGPLTPGGGAARTKILEVVDSVRPLLAAEPRVRFTGPVDSAIPETVIEDVLAVVREALTNVARHADASRVDLDVSIDGGALELSVADDGVGLRDNDRRSGLANLRLRAERLGGTLTVSDGTAAEGGHERKGTTLRWRIPLP